MLVRKRADIGYDYSLVVFGPHQCRRSRGHDLRLKKCNALLGLLTILALFVHMAYNVFAYLAFYYNPAVTTLTAVPILVFLCLHAITGMCSVFLLGDGTRVSPYERQNRRTVVQRVSAAPIFPLLIVHLNAFGLLKGSAENGSWILYALVSVAQLAFYAAVLLHVATSLSRGFITLGLLSSRETQAKIDRFVAVLCVLLFLVASFVVTKGQLSMFLPA